MLGNGAQTAKKALGIWIKLISIRNAYKTLKRVLGKKNSDHLDHAVLALPLTALEAHSYP